MRHVSRLKVSVYFLMGMALTGCGSSNYSTDYLPAASGKYASMTTAFPGVVMVFIPNSGGMCTGILVSDKAVLTAAHCVLADGMYTVRTSAGLFGTSEKQRNGSGGVNDTQDVGMLIFSSPITDDLSEIFDFGDQVSEGDAVEIVGFGCNDIEARTGTGIKRAGSNTIAQKNSEYLVLLTPQSSVVHQHIMGDAAQAGTCFGDSGGPLFKNVNGEWKVVGITHAGGTSSGYYYSEFVNVVDNANNRNFLHQMNSNYSLGMSI